MHPSTRRVVSYIEEQGTVDARQLSDHFGYTRSLSARKLKKLYDQGHLVRTHKYLDEGPVYYIYSISGEDSAPSIIRSRYELHPTTKRVLLHIIEVNGGQTNSYKLADEMGYSRQVASRKLKILLDKGYVLREETYTEDGFFYTYIANLKEDEHEKMAAIYGT